MSQREAEMTGLLEQVSIAINNVLQGQRGVVGYAVQLVFVDGTANAQQAARDDLGPEVLRCAMVALGRSSGEPHGKFPGTAPPVPPQKLDS